MNIDGLDISILGPAFVAGLLVLSTHVPLGQQVLSRGIIFIDLAIAQIAGLGVIAADSFGWEPNGWAVQGVAVLAALLGALLLNWTERRFRQIQEALIGVLFVVAATGGILLLSHNPHGGEHLKELLVGQILWVSYSQLIPVAILYALILAVWFGARHSRSLLFYVLFALAVTASVQMVGVYLVFSSLIIPALAVRQLRGNSLWLAYGMGACGYALGLLASALFDLPTGAVIVWSLAVLAVVTAWLIPAPAKEPAAEAVRGDAYD
jgi:zinc/manganese transport system permease protein